MINLIFGSCAVKHWFPDYRTPNDVDYINKENGYWVDAFEYLSNNQHQQYVDPDLLFTIKVSHAAWDIHWDKTMHDIVFLKNKGCKLDKIFFDLLYKDWNNYHKAKTVHFTKENKDFFRENITRKIDHDSLHEMLAFYDRPLHESIRKDPDSPICSEELFNKLSYDDQIKCALEEIYVIATERWIFKGYPLKFSKYQSMKTLITSASKGWFNLFLILNFDTLIYYENASWKQKLLTHGILEK